MFNSLDKLKPKNKLNIKKIFDGINENLTTFFIHFEWERQENIFLEVE